VRAAALDVADQQKTHSSDSMTLAVRVAVELFRLVKREQELHREILAFSHFAQSQPGENQQALSSYL
jgi:hypothetical protein